MRKERRTKAIDIIKIAVPITLFIGMLGYAANAQATTSGNCVIHLKKKSALTKTAYTKSGESISASIIKKLSDQCEFKVSLMSLAEKRAFDIKRLRARLTKLRGL